MESRINFLTNKSIRFEKHGAMSKRKVRQTDKDRILLTETLPYEVPVLFSNSGFYTVAYFNNSTKNQIDINFEVDGVKSDSIQFTSLNPKVKINLISRTNDYVLNPENVKLFLSKRLYW